jgi:LacI family transcriptional regulator
VSRARTLSDVAKIAQVSPSTVSRILNGTAVVSSEKRKQVEDAIASLGYRPNVMAQGLAKGRSMTVGVITQSISSPFYGEILAGIEQGFADSGYHPMFISGHWRADEEREAIEILMSRRSDALMVLGGQLEDQYLLELAKQVPVVAIGRVIVGLESQCIHVDQVGGAALAVGHLVELGHRRIAHITGPDSNREASERLAGYRQALEMAGLAVDQDLVMAGNFLEQSGYLAMEQLLSRYTDVTAVFAANDQMAFGARLSLYRRGIRVPEDVSIVGFDDLFVSSYSTPPLTTVRQPADEMGRAAAELTFALLEKRSHLAPHFTASLALRESTMRLRR